MNNWSQSVDSLLDKIRLNSIQLTNKHIQNHLYYKFCSVYFEIPTIILSVFSGSFSVGSDDFLSQEYIPIAYNVFYFYGYNYSYKHQSIHENYRE